MFSGLLFVRLKAAENALRDGRLDEAYRLATTPDLRAHRRGAAVLAGLTERFLARAREHFRADRFDEALADVAKAEAGGVQVDRVAELRDQICAVAAEETRREDERRRHRAAAMRRVADGSLAAGRRIMEAASQRDLDAEAVRRDLDRRGEDVHEAVGQAERLIDDGRLAAAADRLERARSIDRHDARLVGVERRLCDVVFERVRNAITQGRLRRASAELACLRAIGKDLPARRELMDMLSAAGAAARDVRAARYGDARRHALTLGRLVPGAAWVGKVIEQLERMDDLRAELCGGPLGEEVDGDGPRAVSGDVGAGGAGRVRRADALADTVAIPGGTRSPGSLPDRLLLLIDGGGSYLLQLGDRTSIGRAAAARLADVPVFSDLAERHADIARVDDDYFLYSRHDVEAGGRSGKQHLLRDGVRVTLGRKAKFTFKKPSRKSSTAVLDLSDTTKMPNDVRRVVLFARHATIGTGPTAHMTCRHATPPLILFARGGSLWVRLKNDGHVDMEAYELRMGAPTEVGGVTMVLEPWTVRGPGSGKA